MHGTTVSWSSAIGDTFPERDVEKRGFKAFLSKEWSEKKVWLITWNVPGFSDATVHDAVLLVAVLLRDRDLNDFTEIAMDWGKWVIVQKGHPLMQTRIFKMRTRL